MMLIDKIIWVLIFVTGTLSLFIISTAVVQYAAAEPYYETINRNAGEVFQSFTHDDPWPAKEFYDSRMISQLMRWDPEPLPMYRLDEIKTYQCDSWKKIIGQIPLPSGILMSMAISHATPYHISVTNYGHTGFVGYLNIPCNEATLGMYDVYFSLWNNPTVWHTDFLETPLIITMEVEVVKP